MQLLRSSRQLNSIAAGKSTMMKTILLQAAVTLGISLSCSFFGAEAAFAALAGGLTATIGNALFGMMLFARGIAPAKTVLRSAYLGEILKWVWTFASLWFCFAMMQLPGLPLVAGLIAAQIAFWAKLIAFR